MPDTRTTRDLDAALDGIRGHQDEAAFVLEAVGTGHSCIAALVNVDSPRLLAVVDALLWEHKIEPLYMNSDDAECGHPAPPDGDQEAWEAAHPEGTGPDGTGTVCKEKIVGHWCRGCADIAVEHGCFTVPKDYPPWNCPVRSTIARVLTGGQDG